MFVWAGRLYGRLSRGPCPCGCTAGRAAFGPPAASGVLYVCVCWPMSSRIISESFCSTYPVWVNPGVSRGQRSKGWVLHSKSRYICYVNGRSPDVKGQGGGCPDTRCFGYKMTPI